MNAPRRLGLVAVVIAAALILMVSVEVVQPGEVVVVRRLGAVERAPLGPGIHLTWPLGLSRRDRVRTGEVRRLTLGAEAAGAVAAPGMIEALTRDLNVVILEADVQYRVSDPVAYVVCAVDREGVLQRAAEGCFAEVVGGESIDGALKEGRAAVALRTEAMLQRLVDQVGLGVEIVGVSVVAVRPPAEVAEAFRGVQAAESGRAQKRFDANRRVTEIRAEARARAIELTARAQAQGEQRVARARGEAERFHALLAQAEGNLALVRQRLFADAMKRLLPGLHKKVIVGPEEGVDLSVMGRE